MVLNFEESFFGMTPIGEVRKRGSGGFENGPAMRLSINSETILSGRGIGYYEADFKF